MCSEISWPQYFYLVALLILIYYMVLWAQFLKSGLPFFGRNSQPRPLSPVGKAGDKNQKENASNVIREIESLFTGKHSANELLYALQSVLKKYHHREDPGFREIINAFIVSESEKKCSILLSEDDLKMVWL